ncbi:trypsin-like serine protease [Acetobacter farinalis]|uniref:Trypsin-like serine protease n=1 Tax=Acetobacter farinalis TaxID=1260984 RepID=A0ABT3Q461_9PROT|nr:trypsin-like serine protease [Acetobacter farinalis]MCX2560011.1 trypsin-like serine protease [Acetobacter farinalis]NHO28668.1 trypsin-like serine protease [Acetobacter farinalis]
MQTKRPARFFALRAGGSFLKSRLSAGALALAAGVGLTLPPHPAAAVGPDYRTHLAGVTPFADPRQRVSTARPPWSAIGRVQTELGSRCTGFLISPVLVETAAHCLWLAHPQRFIQPGSVHFLRAYSGDSFTAHARVVRFIVPPDYSPNRETQSAGLDHATLVLDHPVARPDEVFHITTTPEDIKPGMAAILGGYEQNMPDVITADLHCHMTGLTQDGTGNLLLSHDCAGTHGSSGAPLLYQNASGWHVLGVQVLANTAHAGGKAVPLLALPNAVPAQAGTQ